MRCASPPERVCARRSSVRYSIPTSIINCRRDSISRKTTFAISRSLAVRHSAPKNSYASAMDIATNSTIFLPFSEPRRTYNASSRRRAPLHLLHASSPKKCLVPSPLHSEHAPYGELKEKSRGSISGYENPSYGHINFAEIIFVPSVASAKEGLSIPIRKSPPDSCKARSIASGKRSFTISPFSENSVRKNSSTSTSMLCFLCFSKTIGSRNFFSTPSTFTTLYPFPSKSYKS